MKNKKTIFCNDCPHCNDQYCNKFNCYLRKSNDATPFSQLNSDTIKSMECIRVTKDKEEKND